MSSLNKSRIMSREKLQLLIEIAFRRIPTEWTLEKDAKGRWVAVPAVTQVRSAKITEIDGWGLRRRFLRLNPGDRKAALQFLEGVGVWRAEPDPSASLGAGNKLVSGAFGARAFNGRALPVPLDDLWRLQQGWLKTLSDPRALKKRFGPPPAPGAKSGQKLFFALQTRMMNEFPMHIEWRRGGAFAVVETITGLEMLIATTHLDLLRRADFGSCARADCGIPFTRRSGHNQIYCSPECAHVVAQRALRERKKREEDRL
jgi:hypothetical protein